METTTHNATVVADCSDYAEAAKRSDAGMTQLNVSSVLPATLAEQIARMQPMFEQRHNEYLQNLRKAIPELTRRFDLPTDVELPMFVYDEYYQYLLQLEKCDECQGSMLSRNGVNGPCNGWIRHPTLHISRARGDGEVYDINTTMSVYPCPTKHHQIETNRRRTKRMDAGLPSLYDGIYPDDLFDRELAAMLKESYETYIVARNGNFSDKMAMPIGLTVSGEISTGKTEAVVAIVNYALRHRFAGKVAFGTPADIYDKIRKSPNYRQFDDNGRQLDMTASEVQALYFDADILIIDDLGTEPNDALHKQFVERLIVRRWSGSDRWLTYITTNLDATQITNRYGARCYSRISMMAPIYETTPYRPEM